jgi:hypothetical protein
VKKSRRFGSLQGLMPPLMGMLLLLKTLDSPRVQALHRFEVFSLVGSGFVFGISWVFLMAWLKPGSFASPQKDQSSALHRDSST